MGFDHGVAQQATAQTLFLISFVDPGHAQFDDRNYRRQAGGASGTIETLPYDGKGVKGIEADEVIFAVEQDVGAAQIFSDPLFEGVPDDCLVSPRCIQRRV